MIRYDSIQSRKVTIKPMINHLKLHSHRRRLAARIGILPFFVLKLRKKETRAIEERKKAKCRFSLQKVARVNAT